MKRHVAPNGRFVYPALWLNASRTAEPIGSALWVSSISTEMLLAVVTSGLTVLMMLRPEEMRSGEGFAPPAGGPRHFTHLRQAVLKPL